MKKYWGLLLVLLLSFGAIVPLLQSGFFPIHDAPQVVRVQQMAQALGEGQFPVRWVGDLGYGFGYPIFNFYAPLAYYVGAFFSLIGFDALLATKLMFIIGILLSGVLMYLLAREFWGEVGGVISGLFYLYAPYHAVNIYVRGAVGEFWAMAFLPLVFLGIYKLSQEKKRLWVIISGIGYALVIFSHNLTAMMLTPLILLIVVVLIILSKNKKRDSKHFLSFMALALGLTAFYWLPAITEMRLTKVFGQIGGGADWRDHFIFLDQLWASPWGFAGSSPGRLDGMSFMIGKLHLVLVVLSLLAMGWFLKKKEKKNAYAILAAFGLFVLSIFFTHQMSTPIWQAIPLMAFVQYPWRFLVFTVFAASFMAGAVRLWFNLLPPLPTKVGSSVATNEESPSMEAGGGFNKNHKITYIGGGVIILILLFFSLKYFQPQTYFDVSAADYINEENIKWETSKISDEYLPKDFPRPQNKNEVAWGKVAVLMGEAEIKNLKLKPHQYSFELKAGEKAEILINTAYFPGWKVWVDGEEIKVTLDNGKIKFTPPPGEHKVIVRFANTPIRALANLISLVSWVGILGFVVIIKKS